MIINAYHRFAAKKRYDRLDTNLLVVVLWSDFKEWVMTVSAYKALIPLMHQTDLATHSVFQIDPTNVESLPASLSHIYTVEDIENLKNSFPARSSKEKQS